MIRFLVLVILFFSLSPPDVFMGFIKSYIQLFAYSSITTDEWKDHLYTYFKDKVSYKNSTPSQSKQGIVTQKASQ